MPEVQGLVDFLAGRIVGEAFRSLTFASISALKTVEPQPSVLRGAAIAGVTRHGKFVDVETAVGHLIFHLAKAGWLRWSERLPVTPLKPGRSPIAMRARLGDGSGFDLTEAGTKKSLAIYVVRDASEVPGIARLGPDPLAPDFSVAVLAAILRGRRTQIKGVLRDQSILAGIGNAYSDEVLHAAKLSPYALAATLDPGEVERLHAAINDVLTAAIATASGKPPASLKDAKRGGMRVHGRDGQPCPVCGERIRSVYFADSALQYCPRCQTGGKQLADRRMSRLMK